MLIIGGGVIGLSCAWRLAQSGCRVRVLERGVCGREASWVASGILDPGSLARSDALARLRRASIAQYPAFTANLRESTGIDPQHLSCGSLDLITDDNQDAAAQRELAAAAGQTTDRGELLVERLSAAAARERIPLLTSDIRGALLKRRVSQVRSPRLLTALRAACIAAGVQLLEQTAVVDFLVDPPTAHNADSRRITGVRTATDTLPARLVLLAAGAYSAQIAEQIGRLLPTHPVRGQILLLDAAQPLRHVVEHGSNYFVGRDDGLVLVGSTQEPEAGFDKRPTAAGVAGLLRLVERFAPGLRDAAVMTAWAGLRPGSADGRPYIGPVPGYTGLLAATGHFRSGLTLAPITAEIVVQLTMAGRSEFDIAAFAPGRSATAEISQASLG